MPSEFKLGTPTERIIEDHQALIFYRSPVSRRLGYNTACRIQTGVHTHIGRVPPLKTLATSIQEVVCIWTPLGTGT